MNSQTAATAATNDQSQRPIGYWLKRVDQLITEAVNKAQTANGVTRPEWQVLNLIQESGAASRAQILALMSAFVDAAGLDEILARLSRHGWVAQNGALWELTAAGQRQHGVILAAQQAVRQRAAQGISPEEYATVIRVLERMADNLAQ